MVHQSPPRRPRSAPWFGTLTACLAFVAVFQSGFTTPTSSWGLGQITSLVLKLPSALTTEPSAFALGKALFGEGQTTIPYLSPMILFLALTRIFNPPSTRPWLGLTLITLSLMGMGGLFGGQSSVLTGSQWVLVTALILLAGKGMAELFQPHSADAPSTGLFAITVLSIIWCVTLAAISLQIGSLPASQGLQTVLAKISLSAPPTLAPEQTLRESAMLQWTLDRTALTAFATMSALLLHFKSRTWVTGSLILMVLAADFFFFPSP